MLIPTNMQDLINYLHYGSGFLLNWSNCKITKPYTTQSKVLLLLHNCCKSFTKNVSNVIIMEFQLTEKEFFTFQIHVEYR